jgi:hypothetical protein
MRRSRLFGALFACAVIIGVSVAIAAPPGGSKASLSITDVAATEGDSGTRSFVFTVQASGSLRGTASVSYATGAGTAVAPGDFASTSGSLTFDRRRKTRTVAVQVVGETVDEQDESFKVQLSGANGVTIADGVGVGTILDDDGPPISGPTIAAAGDVACDPADTSYNGGQGSGLVCRQLATSDLLVAGNYAAVLGLGDLQYEDGAYSKFNVSYGASWGRVKAITKPTPGNHEYGTANAEGYFQYFGAAAGDPSKGYYSFDVGSWHLIALNSNCAAVGGCSAGSPQEQWLRADLAASTARCTLAFWHHPSFSSGEHGSDSAYTAFWQALYDANADAVLVGHDHDYERFAPQSPTGGLDLTRGLREFVVGTGGKNQRAFPSVRPNSEARSATSLGILEVTLGATAYDWRFVSASGSFTDSGSTSCH